MAVDYELLLRNLERELESESEDEFEFEDEMEQTIPTPADGAGSCSGWESDPQSFSVDAVKYYLRKVWGPQFSVSNVAVIAPPPNWSCNVSVTTGAGSIVLNVQLAPADKLVRVVRLSDPRNHMVCLYGYRCLTSGRLVFDAATCPTF